MASRNWRPWEADDSLLTDLFAGGATDEELATTMDRSLNAVRLRRRFLGLLRQKPNEKLDCPISGPKLREMYYAKSMSAEAIGREVAKSDGREMPYGQDVVLRWLRENGCKIKKSADNLTDAHRDRPEEMAQYRRKGTLVHADNVKAGITPPHVEQLHTKKSKRKAKKNWKRNFDASETVLVKCRRPDCQVILRRSKSSVARSPIIYCSHRCQRLGKRPLGGPPDWNALEDAILIAEWQTSTDRLLSDKIGRTIPSVRQRRRVLGLSRKLA